MAQTIRCSRYPDAAIHRAGPYRQARATSGASPRLPVRADAPARYRSGPDHALRTTPGSRDTFGPTTRFQPSVSLRRHSPPTGAGTILRPESVTRNFDVNAQHAVLAVATHGTASLDNEVRCQPWDCHCCPA